MGDTDHNHDADAEAVDTDEATDTEDATEDNADASQNNDANDADDDSDDTDGDDTDSDAEGDNDDDSKGDSDKSTDTADDNDDDAEDEDDGDEPELRKPKAGASNKEWAAWRAQEKAKKTAAKKSGDDKDSDDNDSDSGDTDDDISPEDAAIDKRISKRLEPFEKQAAEQEVEASIATFLKDNPDFAPFAAKVKRFANHPNRANVPVKSIFYEVAGDKLLKMGAARGKAADAKAKNTKTGGSNANTDGKGSKDYANMPLSDFGKELEDIKVNGSKA